MVKGILSCEQGVCLLWKLCNTSYNINIPGFVQLCTATGGTRPYLHPVHMRLSNRFGTNSNQFGRHVNASKKCQINSKPVWSKPVLESRFEIGLEPIWGYKLSCESSSDLKSIWFKGFLFITPVIINRFASYLS